MSCLKTLKGIEMSCDPQLAGISEVWFGQYGEFNVVVTESAHTVSNLTAASGATDAVLYHYAFAKQTGSLTSTITIDEANGVRYYTNALTLQFNRLEAEKHVEIEALAAGQLIAIVHDLNDNYWFVGFDSYLSATEATAQSGQEFGSLNGYTLSMSAMSGHLPYKIEKSTFESLIDE